MVGKDLVDLVDDRLGGYQNAFETDIKMRFINEGKDEIWTILKNLDDDYFGITSQSTDSAAPSYFPPLTNTNRNYTLPSDFREIRYVECVTSGYEQLVFVHKYLNDPDFRSARKAANIDRTTTPTGEYFYTFQGKDQFILAQFPEANLIINLFYIRSLPDFEFDDSVDEIIAPFAKKIADYAVKKMMLPVQDEGLFAAWSTQWKENIQTIASSASPRDQADPQFVQDFTA